MKVVPRDTDRYGRVVADVVLPDGRVLNDELVKAGLAWWYRHHAQNIGTLPQLEAGAREAKRGLSVRNRTRCRPGSGVGRSERPLGPSWRGDSSRTAEVTSTTPPGCRNAATISAANRVVFESAQAAERAGYRPGKDCHPAIRSRGDERVPGRRGGLSHRCVL